MTKGVAESVEFRLVMNQLIWVVFRTDPYSNDAIFRRVMPSSTESRPFDPCQDADILRKKADSSQHEWLQTLSEYEKEGY